MPSMNYTDTFQVLYYFATTDELITEPHTYRRGKTDVRYDWRFSLKDLEWKDVPTINGAWTPIYCTDVPFDFENFKNLAEGFYTNKEWLDLAIRFLDNSQDCQFEEDLMFYRKIAFDLLVPLTFILVNPYISLRPTADQITKILKANAYLLELDTLLISYKIPTTKSLRELLNVIYVEDTENFKYPTHQNTEQYKLQLELLKAIPSLGT